MSLPRTARRPQPEARKAAPVALTNGLGESLKIGDVARRLGVSASLVRAWERLGLAQPARTDSKYRIYTNEDFKALRRAVYLRRVQGLNAAAIAQQLKQEGLLRETTPSHASSGESP